MSLTKEQEHHKEVSHNGVIIVERVDIIKENGVVIAENRDRTVFQPGDDVSNEHHTVSAIASVIWTEDVISDYQAFLDASVPDETEDP